MTTCHRCRLSPCACRYMDGLTGPLADVARSQARLPRPHRAACPCPSCYSDRLRSFGVPTDLVDPSDVARGRCESRRESRRDALPEGTA